MVKESKPSINLALLTSPIKNIRLSLSNKTGYSHESNSVNTDISDGIISNTSITGDFRFLKHAFGYINYDLTFHKYYKGLGIDTNIQNLSLAAGYRFLDGKLGISISANDLLNQMQRYTMTVSGSEMTQKWNPCQGRYFLLNIAYCFSNQD